MTRTYQVISADDHIIEPPDVWQRRVPAALRDRAPRAIKKDGKDWWLVDGEERMHIGLSAMAGKRYDEYTVAPVGYDDMRPGCFDARARLVDMDQDGVDASVLFPSLPGLGGEAFTVMPDPALRRACIRAYNDWLAEEFCAADPDRLIGLGIVPFIHVDEAIDELRHIARLGLRGVSLPAWPETIGGKPLAAPAYEPFWAAVAEIGLPVNFHIASGRLPLQLTPATTQAEVFVTMAPASNAALLMGLLWSGLLERFPTLKIVSVESGAGWLLYFLERADVVYKRHRFWTKSTLKEPPRFYFDRQCYAAFLEDHGAVFARHQIGIGNLLWECDYPHSDTTWPYSRKFIAEQFKDVPEAERQQIVAGNAARLYGLTAAAAARQAV
jgi:predicted TIM-barrel fold metal-dependent hydrolase